MPDAQPAPIVAPDGRTLGAGRRLALLALLTALATVLVVALASVPGGAPDGEALAGDPPPCPPPTSDGYVGSQACQPCHRTEYTLWKDTLHSRMEQPATPETVRGNFTPEGTVVEAKAEGRRIVMIREGDAYWIEAPDAAGQPHRYRIERTVGNRYKQRYLTKLANGAYQALPVQWFMKDDEFVEWHGLASGEKGSGHFWLDDTWQWQMKCAGCHTTGLSLGYDPATKSYDTRWNELAIGCEACHGPGETHVRAKGGVGNILCPSKMDHQQQLDVCGKCHSRGTAGPEQGAPAGLPTRLAYPYNLLPGSDLDRFYVQNTPEKNPSDFYGDGSSKNHHQQWNDYQRSRMLHEGGPASPTCTTCHDPHRADALRSTIDDNRLCLQCHGEFRERDALAAHTGHGHNPLANPGARCVECHMPRIVKHAGSVHLRSHTFWGPNPRRAHETGTPDACLLCHTDQDAAWSIAKAEAIWPDLVK